MTDDFFPEARPTRPIWLVTLADLALLLVGFFVLVQANQKRDFPALAKGLREGFGVRAAANDVAPSAPSPGRTVPEPMPVGVSVMSGFAAGSSTLPQSPDGLVGWVRDQARDPRVSLKIIGSAGATADDVDPETGSASVLAADRARRAAVVLAKGAAIPANRVTITTDVGPGAPRAVTLTIGFAGERQ